MRPLKGDQEKYLALSLLASLEEDADLFFRVASSRMVGTSQRSKFLLVLSENGLDSLRPPAHAPCGPSSRRLTMRTATRAVATPMSGSPHGHGKRLGREVPARYQPPAPNTECRNGGRCFQISKMT